MPVQQRPLFGALLLAAFITVCLAWLFSGLGRVLPWWGYPLVFGVFAIWLYAVGRMLTETGRRGERVSSFDVSIEGP